MKIYIAASWKFVDVVTELTATLRALGYTVPSWIEENNKNLMTDGTFSMWVSSRHGEKQFLFDNRDIRREFHELSLSAADLVVYFSGSGCDAAAEIGYAYARGIPIVGLVVLNELKLGLMRRMVTLGWCSTIHELLKVIRSCHTSHRRRGPFDVLNFKESS